MGFGSIWHWVIVLIVVLVLFGRGRVSEIMGDFGKGIKSFKEGMSEDKPAPPAAPPAQIPSAVTPPEAAPPAASPAAEQPGTTTSETAKT